MLPLQLKTSCQNQSVLNTSDWWDSVSSFNVSTTTESLAAAAKGRLLIPAISPSPSVSVAMITPGRSWAQYSFYKYIACTLQITSKQVKIHNRWGHVFLFSAKCHNEMNAMSAIIAARDLVRPPELKLWYIIQIYLCAGIETCDKWNTAYLKKVPVH